MITRVLLVDDCIDQVQALAELMGSDTLSVSVAVSGRNAIERIRSEAPDAVVTDLGLPDLNGVDIVRCARAMRPDVRVVIVTGYPQTHPLVIEATREHIPCREKPLDVRELVALVQRIEPAAGKRRTHQRAR